MEAILPTKGRGVAAVDLVRWASIDPTTLRDRACERRAAAIQAAQDAQACRFTRRIGEMQIESASAPRVNQIFCADPDIMPWLSKTTVNVDDETWTPKWRYELTVAPYRTPDYCAFSPAVRRTAEGCTQEIIFETPGV